MGNGRDIMDSGERWGSDPAACALKGAERQPEFCDFFRSVAFMRLRVRDETSEEVSAHVQVIDECTWIQIFFSPIDFILCCVVAATSHEVLHHLMLDDKGAKLLRYRIRDTEECDLIDVTDPVDLEFEVACHHLECKLLERRLEVLGENETLEDSPFKCNEKRWTLRLKLSPFCQDVSSGDWHGRTLLRNETPVGIASAICPRCERSATCR